MKPKHFEKNKLNININDKTLLDFKKSKSLSFVSKISDLKSSKIGELEEVKPIHDNMHKLCQNKLQKKTVKNIPLTKQVSKDICECLFEKNKALSIAELEKRVLSRTETPASSCISILDKYNQHNNNAYKNKQLGKSKQSKQLGKSKQSKQLGKSKQSKQLGKSKQSKHMHMHTHTHTHISKK